MAAIRCGSHRLRRSSAGCRAALGTASQQLGLSDPVAQFCSEALRTGHTLRGPWSRESPDDEAEAAASVQVYRIGDQQWAEQNRDHLAIGEAADERGDPEDHPERS